MEVESRIKVKLCQFQDDGWQSDNHAVITSKVEVLKAIFKKEYPQLGEAYYNLLDDDDWIAEDSRRKNFERGFCLRIVKGQIF